MNYLTKLLAVVLCVSVVFGLMLNVTAEEAWGALLYSVCFESKEGLSGEGVKFLATVGDGEDAYLSYDIDMGGGCVPGTNAIRFTAQKYADTKSGRRLFNLKESNFRFELGKKYRITWWAKAKQASSGTESVRMRVFFDMGSNEETRFKWINSDSENVNDYNRYPESGVSYALTDKWALYSKEIYIVDLKDADANPEDGAVNGIFMMDSREFAPGDIIWVDDIRYEQVDYEDPTGPSASNVTISGDAELGQVLTGSFNYSPSEDGSAEDGSYYVWEYSDCENGPFNTIKLTSDGKYSVGIKDSGSWLRLRIIPRDAKGRLGIGAVSSPVKVMGKPEFFVSPDGDDANPGTIDAPKKTIAAVKNEIGMIPQKPSGGITVNIRGGVYEISETIRFGSVDSGTEDCLITYKAYNDEKVTLVGGKTLDSSKAVRVTDEAILDKLVDPDAKKHLYMLDLGEQGITMDPVLPWGWSHQTGTKHDFDKDPDGVKETIINPQMRIYMNNRVLEDARWPNNDQSQLLIKCRPLTKDDGIDEDKINAPRTPVMMEFPHPDQRTEFPDIDKRIAKWDITENDSYIGGAVAYFWASEQLRLKSAGYDSERGINVLETNDISTYGLVKDVGWGPQYKIYFGNIFSEIDKPGESYVDRTGRLGKPGVVYFYPVGDVKNAEIVVSTFRDSMISASKASYITFEGIDFQNTVGTPVNLENCNNITIKDSSVSNTSAGGINCKQCKNLTISGCDFYTTGSCPLYVSGVEADRKLLVPTNILIENNKFHNTNLLSTNRDSRTAVKLASTVGALVRHNEFNDIGFGALDITNANDTIFEYNVVKNAEQISTDAGAVYWWHDITTLGNVVRYNFFDNIGSHLVSNLLGGGGSASIFIDDASTAGEYYGNVFLNGGADRGVTCANGAEFGNVYGNIAIQTDFARSNAAYEHRVWSLTEKFDSVYRPYLTRTKASYSSYLYHSDFIDLFGRPNSGMKYREYLWTDEWKEHYKGTWWEGAINRYSKERYDAVKELYDRGEAIEVLNLLSNDPEFALANEYSNNIHNNVAIGELGMTTRANHFDNYLGTDEQITAEDKALFVDFDNKNFTLTAEGLAKIRTKAPEFEDIPFDEIGLLTEVGGHDPVATIAPGMFTGTIAPDNTISAAYEFYDADGDGEGATKIYWYISDSMDGDCELIMGVEGSELIIKDEYMDKFLKYEVVPYDNNMNRGEPVMSDYISVKQNESGYKLFVTAVREKAEIVVRADVDRNITEGSLLMAVYNSRNEMIDCAIVPDSFYIIKKEFEDDSNASYVKVFLWNGISSLEPITEAIKIELE